MSAPILLDASCVLAWLFDERGGEMVESVLTTSYITAVNMAEVIRLVDRLTGQGSACADDLVEAGLTVVPFGWMHLGRIASLPSPINSKQRLSLGDSCCLAYGISHDMDIWTADQEWGQLELNATITLIR